MISRDLENLIINDCYKKKAILLFGARQVGKTTMLKAVVNKLNRKTLFLNGDEADVREVLTNTTSAKLRLLFGGHDLIIIDEAQKIDNIGTTLKLCTDNIDGIQIIATGSSAFELANRANEPLTGRKFECMLFPLSFSEMVAHHGFLQESRLIEHRMIFGYYPEIVTQQGQEERLLKLLANSYLYKDLLMLEQIKRPVLIEKILKALALQIGSEVSYNELAQIVGTDMQTVEKYIEILEKAFIVFKLPALSRNVRNEIKKGKKFYFYDNGVRNAIIGNFNNCNSRTDVGALWENFAVSERYKKNRYKEKTVNTYFWRTIQQQEIDYVEEQNGEFSVFEFKWKSGKQTKPSKTFTNSYKVVSEATISPSNIEDFLLT